MRLIISLMLVFLFNFALNADVKLTREGTSDFPIGDVYLSNPEINKTTTRVQLKVDKSGLLKGNFVHVYGELEESSTLTEIPVTNISVLEANVYYHANRASEYLMANRFYGLNAPLNIVLSYKVKNPVYIEPYSKTIVFGKKSFTKHALDADIISSVVTRTMLMAFLGVEKQEQITNDVEIIMSGISYYFACVISQVPIFASSIRNQNISDLQSIKNSDDASLKLAYGLWTISLSIGPVATNALTLLSLYYMRVCSYPTLWNFMYYIMQADQYLYTGVHKHIISDAFTQAGLIF